MKATVFVFLGLLGLAFAGLIAYIATSWSKWTGKQRKYSIAGMAGGIAIIAMTTLVFQSSAITFATPSELLAKFEKGEIKAGEELKLEGEIVKGSVKSTNFNNVTDFKLKEGKSIINVHYEGVKPDNLERSDVVVRAVAIGSYNGKVFHANDLKTRCPSKYEAAKPKKETK